MSHYNTTFPESLSMCPEQFINLQLFLLTQVVQRAQSNSTQLSSTQLNSTQPQIGYLFSQVTPLVCQASLLRETVWTHLPHEAHLTSWPVPKLACPKASQSPNHLKQTSTDWYSRNSDRRGPRRRMWWRVHRFCWRWLLNFWKYDLPTCRSLNWPTLAWHCTKDY